MVQKLLFVFCLISIIAGVGSAQKTVTNADLEVYRQARLEAEREYRENHERLGMPSPEELQRRNDQSRVETVELAERLRERRLEEERLEIERLRANQIANPQYVELINTIQYAPERNYVPGIFYSNRRNSRSRFINRNVRQGYFAGGQFWPSGPRTQSRPIVRIRRR